MIGRTDLEDGMKKLDKLTNKEVAMASAKLLKVTHNIDNGVLVANSNIKAVYDKVQKMADGRQRLFSES